MNPDDLIKRIEELEKFKKSLEASTSIPQPVYAAFKDRFSDIVGITVSAKGANSEDVTVDEAGSNTYAVMNDPVGFLQVRINNTIYYIPYFS